MDNELYHYGILGMRWGHHKAKSSKSSGSKSKKSKKDVDLGDNADTSSYSKKQTKQLSSDDLKKRINRARLEQSYKEVADSKNAISRGKKALQRLVIVAATGAAVSALQANFRDLIVSGGNALESAVSGVFKR